MEQLEAGGGNACSLACSAMATALQACPSGTRGVSQGEKQPPKNFQIRQHVFPRRKVMVQGTRITCCPSLAGDKVCKSEITGAISFSYVCIQCLQHDIPVSAMSSRYLHNKK